MRQYVLCLLRCSLICVPHASAAAQDVPRAAAPPELGIEALSECKAALELAAAALQNVDIRFTVRVDWLVPNLPRVTGESGHIYLDNGKMYYRFERTFPPLPRREHVVELEEITYDGNVYYLGKNSEGGSPFTKTMLGDNPNGQHAWQHFTKQCPYLEVAGYQLPQKVAQWRGGNLTSIALDYLAAGRVDRVNRSDEDGTSSFVVSLTIPEPVVVGAKTMDLDLKAEEMRQSGSSDEEIETEIDRWRRLRESGRQRRVDLRFSPKMSYALVRRVESTLDGALIQTTEAADFKQFAEHGVWFPQAGTIKTYVRDPFLVEGFSSEPIRTDQIRLQRIGFGPRHDISFVLDYGPGTAIIDASSEAAKSSASGEVAYTEPASLDELQRAAKARRRVPWLLVINAILLAILIAGVAYSKLRRRGAR